MSYISEDRSKLEAMIYKWTLQISRERFLAETPAEQKLAPSLEIAKGEMCDVLSRFSLEDCRFAHECEKMDDEPKAEGEKKDKPKTEGKKKEDKPKAKGVKKVGK